MSEADNDPTPQVVVRGATYGSSTGNGERLIGLAFWEPGYYNTGLEDVIAVDADIPVLILLRRKPNNGGWIMAVSDPTQRETAAEITVHTSQGSVTLPVQLPQTPWAGSTVTFQFLTTGNDVWGWTTWGSPAVYASTNENNNLALGAPVSVSSEDGEGAGWDPSYLTDGNVDGGTNGRNGWSSVSHPSPTATEWAVIDLRSTQSIGKVVLFSRSDLVDFTGTGFPTAFQIQGSNDSTSWTTLVNESDYPGAKAGEGQVFTFLQASARFLRLYATELGGVGTESGYRFQLTEAEVYA